MATREIIKVQGFEITIDDKDFISLTDMLRAKDGDFFISDWLRNRNTVEFLGIWESINNSNFNYGEFAIIKSNAGLNNYKISAKEWASKTNAIGIKARAGRYGGTYAHKDIAFEFGMWISPQFKLYLIKEFERLKSAEYIAEKLEWNARRMISKANYRIHTDAIKSQLPKSLTEKEINITYASEADVLNVALFGVTAVEWRINNKGKKGNIRDYATIQQLVVLANIESYNAEMIRDHLDQHSRLKRLNIAAIAQLESLTKSSKIKQFEDKEEG
ncbi:MAG: hypothetical protein CEN91_60 [Candidatus Berkelbacteria bacterium Licking1014_85]|uniref:KilA-N domain-containing protein n=1 Tax=Candidatus Berkelbacteria bacterium Licking1014_85 TaxID=2017148 RepID=A0A554LM51_9BACT|nr:MAG: hypothetical protein CEN91_60 [Candidatus Berkelbacteria bacterium Licking1014_85]